MAGFFMSRSKKFLGQKKAAVARGNGGLKEAGSGDN
jgi:hypothetical protein